MTKVEIAANVVQWLMAKLIPFCWGMLFTLYFMGIDFGKAHRRFERALEKIKEQESLLREYQSRDESWEAAKASGSDCLLGKAKGKKEISQYFGTWKFDDEDK